MTAPMQGWQPTNPCRFVAGWVRSPRLDAVQGPDGLSAGFAAQGATLMQDSVGWEPR